MGHEEVYIAIVDWYASFCDYTYPWRMVVMTECFEKCVPGCQAWIDKYVGSDCRAAVFGMHVTVCASALVWLLPGELLPSQQEAEYIFRVLFQQINKQTNLTLSLRKHRDRKQFPNIGLIKKSNTHKSNLTSCACKVDLSPSPLASREITWQGTACQVDLTSWLVSLPSCPSSNHLTSYNLSSQLDLSSQFDKSSYQHKCGTLRGKPIKDRIQEFLFSWAGVRDGSWKANKERNMILELHVKSITTPGPWANFALISDQLWLIVTNSFVMGHFLIKLNGSRFFCRFVFIFNYLPVNYFSFLDVLGCEVHHFLMEEIFF